MVDTTGEVIGSQVEGMERRVIGQMQAWYYPVDQVIVYWECEVFRGFHQASPDYPSQDAALITLWERFEQHLWEIFPGVKQMITPGWEPKYAPETWAAFLSDRGYTTDVRLSRAFSKTPARRPAPTQR